MSNKSVIKHTINQIISPPETPAAPVAKPPVADPQKEYVDKELTCKGCGVTFTWSAEVQAWYTDKGLAHVPKWCDACRKQRRQYFLDHPTIVRKK